jgi:hypothetical protein
MTNGFRAEPGELVTHAEALAAAAARLQALAPPDAPAAGRSTHEIAAAIARVVGEVEAGGLVLSDLGAAFAEAAAEYADVDGAVARTLGSW